MTTTHRPKDVLERLTIVYLRASDEAAWENHTEEDEAAEEAAWSKLEAHWDLNRGRRITLNGEVLREAGEVATIGVYSYVRRFDNCCNWEKV